MSGPGADVQDSGEQAATAERLAAERERLEAIRRRVLNVIGHELRTPVSTLRGLAEAAGDADDETLRDEILPALVRNARRTEGLLDDMLIASGIDTALPIEAPEPVEVAPVVAEVWAGLDAADGRPAPAVTGDARARCTPESFRGLLARVLENAARYTRGGEPAVTVETVGARVRVVVDVPGPEMHPEEVELAVEPFFRGEHAVMSVPGLGLGLPIARALAEQTGGSLAVEARPGGGLRTVIELEAA